MSLIKSVVVKKKGREISAISRPFPVGRYFQFHTALPQALRMKCFFGAATQIRTGDLILTKDVLYQLSHSSISTDISAER